ncbi:hypothetical protein [Parapedobacter tibetensis]|uniref:hypothetical protein n=1 Tax=Parapedobacter tibetensis TaxID=2972951 RepID=UPI00214D2727|nr:hypothetical protein [Parapedobacter tibetensis]
MKSIIGLIVAALTLCVGCTDNLIVYTYKGTSVTRKDIGATTYLYYGDYSKGKYPNSYVKITYSGFNNGLLAHLIFNSDSSVEIRRGNGYFDFKRNKTEKLFAKEIENPDNIRWHDSIKGRFDDVVFLTDVLSLERSENTKNKSKVTARYIKEKK